MFPICGKRCGSKRGNRKEQDRTEIEMNDIKLLWRWFREHKMSCLVAAASAILGAVIGAFLGAMAYYNGWLG